MPRIASICATCVLIACGHVKKPSAPASDGAAGGSSTPQKTGRSAGNCSLGSLKIIEPNDICEATYSCESGIELSLTCDGENDGSHTSLCDCRSGSKRVGSGGLIEGEGPEACERAVSACLKALGY